MRLIDSDVLEQEIKIVIAAILHKFGSAPLAMEACEAMSAVVARMHSMGAVELVKCKECIHLLEKGKCALDAGDLYEMGLSLPRSQSDFCSYGERKNNHEQTD